MPVFPSIGINIVSHQLRSFSRQIAEPNLLYNRPLLIKPSNIPTFKITNSFEEPFILGTSNMASGRLKFFLYTFYFSQSKELDDLDWIYCI